MKTVYVDKVNVWQDYYCPSCTRLYWGAKEEPRLFFDEPPEEGGIVTRVGQGSYILAAALHPDCLLPLSL
jgi:hypothetical protein